jgi:hypothetical protein
MFFYNPPNNAENEKKACSQRLLFDCGFTARIPGAEIYLFDSNGPPGYELLISLKIQVRANVQ